MAQWMLLNLHQQNSPPIRHCQHSLTQYTEARSPWWSANATRYVPHLLPCLSLSFLLSSPRNPYGSRICRFDPFFLNVDTPRLIHFLDHSSSSSLLWWWLSNGVCGSLVLLGNEFWSEGIQRSLVRILFPAHIRGLCDDVCYSDAFLFNPRLSTE
jgi:hypothetical protein